MAPNRRRPRAAEKKSPRPLLTRAVRKFLQQPRTARLATIGPGGYPHLVPIWFMLDGDDLVFGTDRDVRKVRNARANPRGAVVIGGEPETDAAGYMIQGDLTVEEDSGHRLIYRLARRYEPPERAETSASEWAASNTVILRLKPKTVIRVM